MAYSFYKKSPNDKVMWVADNKIIGQHLFSFDGLKIFNLFSDYPSKLTKEQKELFDAENPFWAEFFKDRVQ